MKKWTRNWVIPAAALALVLFLAGYLLGRSSSPLEISAQTQHPMPVVTAPAAPAVLPEKPQSGLVDLNRADKEELMTLPGIGEVLAERILEYRTVSGGFLDVRQLMEVEGIGQAKFAELAPCVTVNVEERQ